MNRIILIGRLCRNPAISYKDGENKTAICKFYIAVDKPYKADRTEGEATADFLPCVLFGSRAETVAKYFKQGDKIAIQGRLSTSSYVKNDEKRYSFSIYVEDFEFCQNKNSSKTDTEGFFESEQSDNEELPF